MSIAKKPRNFFIGVYYLLNALVRAIFVIILFLMVLLLVGMINLYYNVKKLITTKRNITGYAENCNSQVKKKTRVYEVGLGIIKFFETPFLSKLFKIKSKSKLNNNQLKSNRYGKKSKNSYNRINRGFR